MGIPKGFVFSRELLNTFINDQEDKRKGSKFSDDSKGIGQYLKR